MSDYFCETHKYNPPEGSGFAVCPQCELPASDGSGDVFALVIEDRHSDTGVEVWADREAAIVRAKALATEYAGYNGGPVDERAIQGWEYYASYSCENDSVRVVKVKLQSPNAPAHRPEREQPKT